MSFYIKINESTTEELPTHEYNQEGELVKLDSARRIIECENIIAKYPQYFEQGLPVGGKNNGQSCDKVVKRLELMATYILAGSTESKKQINILTDYKEKRNKTSEIHFSTIEKHGEMNKN